MVCGDVLPPSRTALRRCYPSHPGGDRRSHIRYDRTFVFSDLFSEEHRGQIFGIFYLNIGLGTAVGYMLGGIRASFGWRYPFYVAAVPGFLLAIAMAFLPEPVRGSHDLLKATGERTTISGLFHNGAFWMATLGMAMTTFAMGGLQVWMPTFLSRSRGVALDHANLVFGGITAFNAIAATFLGGWLGDPLAEANGVGLLPGFGGDACSVDACHVAGHV